MASFNHLSLELVDLIAEQLYFTGPLISLKALNLVSRRFHKICSRFLYQNVLIDLMALNTEQVGPFVNFLHRQPDVRSHIRNITIPSYGYGQGYGFVGYHEKLQDSFVRLLPLFPKLEHVRVGGDECLDYDKIDLRPLKPSVLSAINALHRPVHLALGCYVHTINTDAQLDEISCLNSLRVCILNTPRVLVHDRLVDANYYNDPSQEVADIVRRNPDLVDLHLSLKANKAEQQHTLHLQTKDDILEHIGCVVPHLESLTLEGDLRFTDKAWTAWATRSIWEQLQTLSVIGMPMVDQITKRLQGQLYNLETLKVSAYDDYQSSDHEEFHDDHGPLMIFLAGLKLTHLCLSGFHPNILFHALESSAATLRYLRFQIRESDMSLQLCGGPPYANLLLSHTILKDIRRQCPLLEWIGLNVKWSDLASEEQHQSNSSKDPDDLDILTTLAKMPSLQHVRLFLTGGQKFEINGPRRTEPLRQVISSAAAIATFSHIRTRKRGAAIRSLMINVRLLHRCCLWRIHELGPRMALLEYCQDTISVKEVWDTETMTLKRREQAGVVRGWHPEWGIGDGW